MATKERIEFRVENSIKRLLEDLARSRGVSLGELLRSMIEAELNELGWSMATRSQAANDLLGLSVGSLPEPDHLQQEIHDAFVEEG